MSDHSLLLVNLGSPKSPAVADVRSYLNQFLMDPYVINLPWLFRRLLVASILIKRPALSSRAYQSIWYKEGSPLTVLSERLCKVMEPHWQHGSVVLAMRYGELSIESKLLMLDQQGVKEITLAPLYPQFAESTVTTILEEVKRVVHKHKLEFKFHLLMPFYQHPLYIQALVSNAQESLQAKFDHLLFSFHGLPESHIRKLIPDPNHNLQAAHSSQVDKAYWDVCYRTQCLRTAELFTELQGVAKDNWSVSFQSRLGHSKWLEPYTMVHINQLLAKGVKRLAVICPAFTVDCLETLEEIGIRARQQFLKAGGVSFELIACLNDSPSWVIALNQLCQPEQTKLWQVDD